MTHNSVLMFSLNGYSVELENVIRKHYMEIVRNTDMINIAIVLIKDAILADIISQVLSDHGKHIEFPIEIWKCDSDKHLREIRSIVMPIVYPDLYFIINDIIISKGVGQSRLISSGDTCILISGEHTSDKTRYHSRG